MRRLRRAVAIGLAGGAGGCGGWQSVLRPQGPQAEHISHLWWLFLAVCSVVYVLVLGFLGLAIARGRGRALPSPEEESGPTLTRAVAVAAGATVVVLFVLLVVSVRTGKAVAEHDDPDPLSIKVTGHQWWWEVEYEDPTPSNQFTTANEIHIPVGRAVILKATSTDVIHSFWVPNLHGKIDLIPTHVNTLWIRADHPGTFRGQCAEFCGLQHAHMALRVVAQAAGDYEAWRRAQLQPAAPAGDPQRAHGQQLFTALPCIVCHTVRGTPANGTIGPDLTHLASRATLAAGTVPNTPGYLSGWIVDPQTLKPGAQMPANPMSGGDLTDLVAYLDGLR